MTLWTPDGERSVGQAEPELTPEQQEQASALAKELTETRSRLLETEVSTVLTNHCLGIYELAAIHLATEKPKMDEAKLAVDALGCLVEGLSGQLGEAESTLTDGLHQLRMLYVQRSGGSANPSPAPTGQTEDN